MFDKVNTKVGEIAGQVCQTLRVERRYFCSRKNQSEKVVIPVAGMILMLILCYELL
ncbi:VirB6/TrbL-like conjugal transfer protein, CD1112 family [Paenibacillus dendritiformis]|uniref:VirB6/TrbL-like conjugal transfer protein, CD1112 family n=1 Tax=Paenibacillus dendritiformis TaxID=130049 RepID=UPI001C65EE3E